MVWNKKPNFTFLPQWLLCFSNTIYSIVYTCLTDGICHVDHTIKYRFYMDWKLAALKPDLTRVWSLCSLFWVIQLYVLATSPCWHRTSTLFPATRCVRCPHGTVWSVCVLGCFSCVRVFATPWTVVGQAPLPMGLSRQEYWSGLPCPPPQGASQPRDQTHDSCVSSTAGRFFTTEPPGKPVPLWRDHHLFNQTSTDGHLGCFQCFLFYKQWCNNLYDLFCKRLNVFVG